jgi:sugar transferase EpsL
MMNRVVGVLLICLFSPLLAIIAIMIWVTMGRPVLFSQERSGQHGVGFKIRKFRTMRTDHAGTLLDEHRITRLGHLLRITSLDELPSLWNIALGEMVFVGPRPLLSRYLASYNDYQRRRLEIRPGLTGWAQINGRNSLTWDQKFELDIWYLENRNWRLDMNIIFLTVPALLRGSGISHAGHVTMPAFEPSYDPHLLGIDSEESVAAPDVTCINVTPGPTRKQDTAQ